MLKLDKPAIIDDMRKNWLAYVIVLLIPSIFREMTFLRWLFMDSTSYVNQPFLILASIFAVFIGLTTRYIAYEWIRFR